MTVTAFLPAALSAGRPHDPVAPPSISQQTGFQTTTTATNGVSNVLNHLGNITNTVDGGVTEGQGDGPGFLRATIDPADKRWQTFTTYDYGHLDVEGATGIQSDTHGGSVGVLYRICPSFAFGGSVGGMYSKGILAAGAGDVRTDGLSMAVFGVATWGDTFADLIYSAALLDSRFNRIAPGTNASGQADSTVHSIGLTVGHNLRFGRWTTGPRLGLNYSHWSQKGYTENGAGVLLAYPDQNTESLVTRVEWFGSYDIKTRYGLLVPRAQLGWHRETMGGAGTSNVGVVGGGVAAGAGGVNRVRHYMMAGAGVSLNFSENWKASVDYVGQFFAANFEVHNVSLMLSYGF